MELLNHGGAKLVVHPSVKQKGNALPDGHQVQIRDTSGLTVTLRAVFHIHGHIVHQPLLHQSLQSIRMGAVRIQLYRIAQRLDVFQQRLQFWPQQRFPAGNAYTVQQTLPFLQKGQKLFIVHLGRIQLGHQLPIVAEGAAKVTAAQKNRTSHLARIIQQRHLLQSVNFHCPLPFLLYLLYYIAAPQKRVVFVSSSVL